jgi:ferritin-like metal-binding protein YciE
MQTATAEQVARKLFVSGLEDIHAIQRDAKSMMLKVIDRLDHYPQARERLQQHLGDKEREMQRAETILNEMGEKPSGTKDGTFSMMGGATAMMTGALPDDVLKTSMLTFGLANYEIALYESLIHLAEPAGQPQAVDLLKQSLSEEKAMAEWLHVNMAPTLDRYLQLSSQGEKAAH